MKILIDLDGITADTLPAWLDCIYKDTGIRALPEDIDKWNLSECEIFAQVPLEKIVDCLSRPGFIAGLPVMVGAQQNLKLLQQDGHDLYFVTARSGEVSVVETYQWMKAHFPWVDLEKQLCFVHDKYLLQADVLIDDKAETLIKYHQVHPKAMLLTIDYAYNRDAHKVFRMPAEEAWGKFRERIESIW